VETAGLIPAVLQFQPNRDAQLQKETAGLIPAESQFRPKTGLKLITPQA
jgi:hypothetical protein